MEATTITGLITIIMEAIIIMVITGLITIIDPITTIAHIIPVDERLLLC